MISLPLRARGEPVSVLCLGAHSDDIEIGAGASLLSWLSDGVALDVHWCVLSAVGQRKKEAENSARQFVSEATQFRFETGGFRDGHFPYEGGQIKEWFEDLKNRAKPDVILTHYGDDAHQDHREVARLTTNTFRDHLVLGYEIPKWDGDLGQPNVFIPVSEAAVARKIELLMAHFGSQRSKDWFEPETFRALARLRGMECRATESYAEAFYCKKMCLR